MIPSAAEASQPSTLDAPPSTLDAPPSTLHAPPAIAGIKACGQRIQRAAAEILRLLEPDGCEEAA